jgi:hypothetical protein
MWVAAAWIKKRGTMAMVIIMRAIWWKLDKGDKSLCGFLAFYINGMVGWHFGRSNVFL